MPASNWGGCAYVAAQSLVWDVASSCSRNKAIGVSQTELVSHSKLLRIVINSFTRYLPSNFYHCSINFQPGGDGEVILGKRIIRRINRFVPNLTRAVPTTKPLIQTTGGMLGSFLFLQYELVSYGQGRVEDYWLHVTHSGNKRITCINKL